MFGKSCLVLALCALTLCTSLPATAGTEGLAPQLLLTPQRLKRLKRDRQRSTDRWANFERRVRTVPDSPERGFELALYYAVTGDEETKAKAEQWSQAHPCALRQVALIADWTGTEATAAAKNCPVSSADTWSARRDRLFLAVAAGNSVEPENQPIAVDAAFLNGPELYALVEYLDAMRTSQHTDPRESSARFFNELPVEFLLSMRPRELTAPTWQAHIAALALVTLDPNLTAAQFLQGWGLEDRLQLREGEGVAYEFLWANPYLPGVSYQNMQPWWYSENGRLLARSDWSEEACWISISPHTRVGEHCSGKWQSEPGKFGNLWLKPMGGGRCLHIDPPSAGEVTIVVSPAPKSKISYHDRDQRLEAATDAAGLWRVPANVNGDVCLAR